MLDIQLTAIFLGLIIGFILALTGAGGAILAIPLLVYVLNLSIAEAAPIALLAIFFASSIGAIQGLRKGIVRYKAALLIALLGIIFAPLGVMLSHYLSLKMLNIIFSAVLVFVSIRVWQQAKNADVSNIDAPSPACAINPATSKLFWTASCTRRLIATGGLTGLLSGLLGVGGGFVIVPSLTKVSNFNSQTIVATTLATVALISISSIFSYMHQSNIVWEIAVPFVMSVTAAMLLLSVWREKIPNTVSQKSFACLCAVAAIYLLVKAFI